MKRAGRLIGALLFGWIATWLSLGLMVGNPTALLHPGTSDALRITYIVILYVWLLVSTTTCWRRYGPRWVRWGSLSDFLITLAVGLVFVCVQRALLWLGGCWTPPAGISPGLVALALLTSPLLAWTEEFLFRGYLYGVVREERGRLPALVLVNAFFALIHLFRPGTLVFKAAYGLGLWLAGVTLSLLLERRSLAAGAGLHSSWVVAGVLDPPGRVLPGWISGLGGDPAAGALGWAMLLGLIGMLYRVDDPAQPREPHVGS